MLDHALLQQLKAYMVNLTRPVALQLNLDNSETSTQLHAFSQQVNELSNLLSLETIHLPASRAPLLTLTNQSNQIAFAGIPTGHEFTSFVLALLHLGGHPIKLESALIEQIANLNPSDKLQFQTYVSLSCQTCPVVVQALNMLAAINPNITHTMIDGALFQEEVEAKNILSVPSVFLNDEAFSVGRISIENILTKLDAGATSKQAELLASKGELDVLVVGGGPAGASAAIYAARKGLKTAVVADTFGGQVAETVGIENFISVSHTEGPKLVKALEQHVKDYDVDVLTSQRASALIHDENTNSLTIELESGSKLTSKTVLIATGARWRNLGVPGEIEYKGKGVAYCPHCDGPLFKAKNVAVIGGGNSGIEAAIDLAGIVKHVTVLEFADSLKADDVLLQKVKQMPNIDIIINAQTTEVLGNGNKVTGIAYEDRVSGKQNNITLDGIFVQIGLVPNSEWLDSTLDLTRFGEIKVDAKGQTSISGVFAAGDVTNSAYKQIIIAMGAGATASLSAFDYLIRQPNTDNEINNTEQAA